MIPLEPTETKVSNEGEGSLLARGLSCKMYVGIEGIKVGKELLGLFYLMNNKGVIHIHEPDPRWAGRGA